jgi:outer membrane cobalamin receptor
MSFFTSLAYKPSKFSVRLIIPFLILKGVCTQFALGFMSDSSAIFITKPVLSIADTNDFILGYGNYAFKKPLSEKLVNVLGSNRLQALALYVPSLELRDYGGPGSLNLFSMRGLGPLRNVILLDGIPLTSTQTGTFDISSIPVFPGQSIALDLGGGSSSIGSGAMSGILDISIHSVRDTAFAMINGGLGSFGEQSMRLQGGIGDSLSSFMMHIDQLSYAGDYPIMFQPAGNVPLKEVNRGNAANSKLTVFAKAMHHFPQEQMKAGLWTSFTQGKRGVPGAVLTAKVEDSEATLSDKDFMLAGTLQFAIASNVIANARASIRNSESNFTDPYALYSGLSGAKFIFLTKDLFSQTEITYLPFSSVLVKSGIMFSNSELRGELLQPFAGDAPSRASGAVFTRVNMNVDDHVMDAAIRIDAFSDQQGPAISGHFAMAHEVFSGYSISAKVTRDFRVPTFNELYYLNYGTQFLRPETSVGIDIGCTYTSGILYGQFSVYHMQVEDQILAIPISPVQWSARNIGMVWSSGIEASLALKIPKINGSMQLNYAAKHVIDKTPDSETFDMQLPYVPAHTISCSIISDFTSHSIGIIFSGIGKRFGMMGELPDSQLESVFLINPHAEYRIGFLGGIIRIRGEIRNLLDAQYQMIMNFPLPGRSYVVNVGYVI